MLGSVLSMLLSACGSSPAATTTPSALARPPSIVAGLHCKVALALWHGAWTGGWLSLPDGAFTADPSSSVSPAPDTADGTGLSYDVALKRWLPASPDVVRPDGQVYAYLAPQQIDGQVRVVDANGRTTVLSVLPHNLVGYHLVSVLPEGVYVTNWRGGLWRLRYSGGIEQLNTKEPWSAVANGFAYGPAAGRGYLNNADEIDRFNLATGEAGPWFVKQGMLWGIAGFAPTGEAVVTWSSGSRTELWLASSPPKLLYATTSFEEVNAAATGWSVVDDAHGMWVATGAALYLYSEQAGWERVWTATPDVFKPGVGQRVALASGCI
jgi:hypothetical protein